VICLNINKRADLSGLHTILKEIKSHLVFLQEVNSYNAVSVLPPSVFLYTLTASTVHTLQRDLIVATLYRLPAIIQEIRLGMAQLVTVGALPFLHLHALPPFPMTLPFSSPASILTWTPLLLLSPSETLKNTLVGQSH
jgi:hypothetical protein